MEGNASESTMSSLDPTSTIEPIDYCEDFWLTGAIRILDSEDLVRYVHWAFLRPPIAVIGMVGNLILLIVLRQPRFRSKTYSYIFWLAIADFGTLTFDVIFLLSTVEKYHRRFGFGISSVLCYFLFPLIYTFSTWSAFMVVVLTVHRLRAVWSPFGFHVQTGKTYLVAFAALVASVILNVAGVFQYTVMRITDGRREEGLDPEVRCYACTWSPLHYTPIIQDGYIYGRECVSKVIPVGLVFLLNIAIIVVYRRRQAQGRVLRSVSGQPDAEERRIVYMLLLIGTLYVICMTPISLYIVAVSTVRKTSTNLDFELFRVAANMLANTQTACNFYLYFFCSQSVRAEFMRLCKETFRGLRAFFSRRPGGLFNCGTRTTAANEMTTF